jgi:CAAX protease family protein
MPPAVPPSGWYPRPPAAPAQGPPAGWYPDPWGQAWLRWWDGTAWTGYVAHPPPPPSWSNPGGPGGWPAPPAAPAPWAGASADPWSHTRPAVGRGDATHGPESSGASFSLEAGPQLRAGGIAALGFLIGFAFSFVIGVAWVIAGGSSDSVVLVALGEIGLWAGLAGSAVVASRVKGTGSLVEDYGLRGRPVDLAVGLAGGVGAHLVTGLVVAVLVYLFGHRLSGSNVTELTNQHGAGALVVSAVILCLGAPLVEELYFRGLVQGTLMARYGGSRAVLMQAGLFACAHLTPTLGWVNVTVFLAIFLFGIMQGLLRWRLRRLGPTIATHAVFNAITFIAVAAT